MNDYFTYAYGKKENTTQEVVADFTQRERVIIDSKNSMSEDENYGTLRRGSKNYYHDRNKNAFHTSESTRALSLCRKKANMQPSFRY